MRVAATAVRVKITLVASIIIKEPKNRVMALTIMPMLWFKD